MTEICQHLFESGPRKDRICGRKYKTINKRNRCHKHRFTDIYNMNELYKRATWMSVGCSK